MGILSRAAAKAAAKKVTKETAEKTAADAAAKKAAAAAARRRAAQESTTSASGRVKNTNPPGQGKRFSDRENTQKGSTDSRKVTATGVTNKNDRIPSFTGTDVIRDQMEDIRVLRRPRSTEVTNKNTPNTASPALRRQQEAARSAAKGRAATRTGVRATAVTASPIAGYAAADYANEKMKKPPAAKTATSASKTAADERENKGDYPTYKKKTESAAGFREAFKKAKDEGKKTFTFEGRKYNTKDK